MDKRLKDALGITIMVFILLASSHTGYGSEPYRTEFSLSYGHGHTDYSDSDLYRNSYSLSAAFYLAPVNISDHPLAEASFLERIGHIEVYTGRHNIDKDNDYEGEGSSLGASITYSKPDMPLVLAVSYGEAEYDYDHDPPFIWLKAESESKSYKISMGNFFQDNLLAGGTFYHSEGDIEYSPLNAKDSYDMDEFMLYIKHVKKLEGGRAFNLEGTIGVIEYDGRSDDYTNQFAWIGGDYYFNRRTSLGGAFMINRGEDDDAEGESYVVRGRHFLSESISLYLGYSRFHADNSEGEDADYYSLQLSQRF